MGSPNANYRPQSLLENQGGGIPPMSLSPQAQANPFYFDGPLIAAAAQPGMTIGSQVDSHHLEPL